jgi:hypothetical protein
MSHADVSCRMVMDTPGLVYDVVAPLIQPNAVAETTTVGWAEVG